MIELAMAGLVNLIPPKWDPYALKLKRGDEIIIIFNNSRHLEYSFKDDISRNVNSDGLTSDIPSTSPKTKWADSSRKNLKGGTQIKTKWNIAVPVKVKEVKENGYEVEGEINSRIDGSEEKVRVIGFVPEGAVSSRKTVPAEKVINLQITYIPQPSQFIISEEDITWEYQTNTVETTNSSGAITTNLEVKLKSSRVAENFEKKIIKDYLSILFGIIFK